MSQILGVYMIAGIFIGQFLMIWSMDSLKVAIGVFLTTAGIASWVAIAVFLMEVGL